MAAAAKDGSTTTRPLPATLARLRIGTRGSPLALVQAAEVERRLRSVHAGIEIERRVIKTTGDTVQDRTLAAIGGKGLFTKELDEALIDGRIDMAVHSMKDMETSLRDGIAIGCVLPREDPRDVMVAREGTSLATLPMGAVLGTASARRQALALARRPDLKVVGLRGNVETRLRKVAEGEVDATLLALAGLRRLGLGHRATAILDPDEMLPAAAQGAIAVTIRAGDEVMRAALAPIDDEPSAIRVGAERACLAELDGSCRTPIAALAEIDGDSFRFRALIALPDGSAVLREERRGPTADAAAIGREAGAALKGRAAPSFFAPEVGASLR
jgi:hydroxymethylbilane synthase